MIIYEYETLLDEHEPKLKIVREIEIEDCNNNSLEYKVFLMNDNYDLDKQSVEQVYLLAIDFYNIIQAIFKISQGSYKESMIPRREIFTSLLLFGATRFILVHNHPRADVTPSDDDIETTKILIKCAKLLELDFIDHIIIGEDRFYSFDKKEIFYNSFD